MPPRIEPDKTQLILVPDEESENVLYAYNYLLLKDQGMSEDDIALKFGYNNRYTLYNRRMEWEADLSMDRAKALFTTPVNEENEMAIIRAARSWPAILNRVVDIALNTKHERVALEAAILVHDWAVVPTAAKEADPGSAESAYAGSANDLNPSVIPAPRKLGAIKP